jgi:hypothetical protein
MSQSPVMVGSDQRTMIDMCFRYNKQSHDEYIFHIPRDVPRAPYLHAFDLSSSVLSLYVIVCTACSIGSIKKISTKLGFPQSVSIFPACLTDSQSRPRLALTFALTTKTNKRVRALVAPLARLTHSRR